MDPLQDPYLSIGTCGSCTKSIWHAFFVALRRENIPIEILCNVSCRRNADFDLVRYIFCGPAQAKCKFDLPKHVFYPYHVDSRGATTGWTEIATALQRDAKKITQPAFRLRKFWSPESRFLWPSSQEKNESDKNLQFDLRDFSLTVTYPQCASLFGKLKLYK